MPSPLFRLWDRLNLKSRLLLAVILSMAIALIGAAYQTARDAAIDIQSDLVVAEQQEMDMLYSMVASALLADIVDPDPNPVRLTAVLENLKHGLEVVYVGFRDTSDVVSFSHETPLPLLAPEWFSRWCGLEELRSNRAVVIEDAYYGVLSLVMSPNGAINQVWGRYLKQMRILFMCFLLAWLSMYWVLRQGLRPLNALATAYDALGRGDFATRLAVFGSPELQTSLSNFNRMASKIEADRNELRASEHRFRILIEQAPDAIIVYDADLERFVDANGVAEKLFGCSREELLRYGPDRFYTPEQPDQRDIGKSVADHITRALSGEKVQFERAIHTADGRDLICEVRVSAMPDERRRLTRGSFIDITERRRAEEKHEKLQAQLNQAQKMESVGSLAGGVAHDYNNMLGVIIGYADLAMGKVDPSQPLYDDLRQIQKAAERSAEVTRQLLAFARKQNISPRVIDLNKTVEGMLKMLRHLIGEDIDLAWLPESGLWPVEMDPSQIDQVIANLCINARDAIAGVGKISIETDNVTFNEAYCADHSGFSPGEFALLAVSDDGCGMDKETLAKIFEPFFTTKGVGRGTGLGLATVYGIIKQNTGFINVYSEPDKGTTFTIYLPRHTGMADQMRPKEPVKPAARGHETVLLVEDEPTILQMAQMMLERLGYTVLTAATPTQATTLAGTHPGEIHLLMTDVIMPEMNGKDLSKRIQALRPAIKCLFMSGYTADVIAHRGVLDEGVNFIRKPFSTKNLATKLRDALDQG